MELSHFTNDSNVFYYTVQDRLFVRFPIEMINHPIVHFIKADNSSGYSVLFDDHSTKKVFIFDAVKEYLCSKNMIVSSQEYSNKCFRFSWEIENKKL